MKKIKSKMNPASNKLLHKMTAFAMPMGEHKPTLHLSGKHAQQFHGHKPGSNISAHIKGRLKNVGFGYDNQPQAEIELNSVRPGMPGPVPPPQGAAAEPGEGTPQEETAPDEEQENPPPKPAVRRKGVK